MQDQIEPKKGVSIRDMPQQWDYTGYRVPFAGRLFHPWQSQARIVVPEIHEVRTTRIGPVREWDPRKRRDRHEAGRLGSPLDFPNPWGPPFPTCSILSLGWLGKGVVRLEFADVNGHCRLRTERRYCQSVWPWR